jgi:putative endonuclease
MFYVYAISSLEHNYIYVGLTQDIDERIKRHNDGRERTTKFYKPFELIYSEDCKTRIDARFQEKYWKSGVGKEKLRTLRDSSK